MPWFKCFAAGENFYRLDDGNVERFGFYTTRWVEAKNSQEAEVKVVEMLRQEPQLARPEWYDGREPRPAVSIERIEEVPADDARDPLGFAFYPMDM